MQLDFLSRLESATAGLERKIVIGERLDTRRQQPKWNDLENVEGLPAWMEYYTIPGIHRTEFQARVRGPKYEVVGTGASLVDAATQVLTLGEYVIQLQKRRPRTAASQALYAVQ